MPGKGVEPTTTTSVRPGTVSAATPAVAASASPPQKPALIHAGRSRPALAGQLLSDSIILVIITIESMMTTVAHSMLLRQDPGRQLLEFAGREVRMRRHRGAAPLAARAVLDALHQRGDGVLVAGVLLRHVLECR